jgi:hypothetical protein
MLRAIAKNDRIDANKICGCLRCDFLPEGYVAPTTILIQCLDRSHLKLLRSGVVFMQMANWRGSTLF